MTEMTCNEFIKSMKEAGFDFTYIATNGTQTFKGRVSKSGEVETVKVKTVAESRQAIKDIFKRSI